MTTPNRTRGQFEVPTEPLRRAFQESGLTAYELAQRLGWARPDTGRVKRTLGLQLDHNGRGTNPRLRQTTSYERAAEIAIALGIDPVDVGL